MKKQLAIMVVPVVLAACSSAPQSSSVAQSSNATQTSAPIKEATKNVSPKSQTLESIYFDFDKFDIKSQFRESIKQHAEWMKAHKTGSVTLEGNTDERGSAEYNLALGSKRAAAVQRALVISGIPKNRIKDVSFGKEKPKATCHDEKCWQENRRVDFIYNQG